MRRLWYIPEYIKEKQVETLHVKVKKGAVCEPVEEVPKLSGGEESDSSAFDFAPESESERSDS